MTGVQLTLGDCDPTWTDNQPDTDTIRGIIPPRYWDLRGQGVTVGQLHTMTTIKTDGTYL